MKAKRNKEERLKLVLGLSKQLRDFPDVNLWNSQFESITKVKQIFNEYVNQDEKHASGRSGKIYCDELNRIIDFILPIKSNVEPLFVLRVHH